MVAKFTCSFFFKTNLLVVFYALLVVGCSNEFNQSLADSGRNETLGATDKIKVLNIGSFHFGETSDAQKTDFDEHDAQNHAEIRHISQLISRFKPTIVCLEFLPEDHLGMNQAYQAFLKSPSRLDTTYGELSMIGFDVARLNNLSKVYGIDNHMGYNYSLGDFIEQSADLENAIDRDTYLMLTNEPFKYSKTLKALNDRYDQLSLLEKLQVTNYPSMLDYMLNANADKLFYVGIDDGFEGAEQAAQFYLRNMKIYSNLNRIKMTPNDRVLILMGSAHTAMLREFIRRSPKFEMVNTNEYLVD
ncbi:MULTISPECIES: DUF5694 domain-containing protein [Pseudomonadati]|uniref:DUF5694 domain-containing protein n=1 Tax=Shewanella aestuarii TaxID=1028752 RepID=A0ABT0L3N9_9GAMM|nr:DUF5694 domain-containing protein [Shewanella aestuarii]MCL1118332.1 DUF5694 domain-containing protein [Shewanella aestuarii]GGN80565.1 hypothetical protein GCM10009193_25870 [Shewanella aestuarii]